MQTSLTKIDAEERVTRNICRALLAFTVALWLTVPLVSTARAHDPEALADLIERLQDSVVNISTAQTIGSSRGIPAPEVPEGSPFKEFFDDFFERQDGNGRRPERVQSLGSGFVIDASGIVITNNHVIAEADEIYVNFNDGTKLQATLIGRDAKTDLAVLKVTPETPLQFVPMGDSDKVRVGHQVVAIGNPFSLGGTVTTGIVSARNRDINSGPYDDFIQTDAAINRGNSGGPLFNMAGEVIGINTAIISPTGGSIGIGFSIPSNNARPVIAQLQTFGETRRGWLGVRIQPVSEDLAEQLGLAKAEGALISGVSENGPAAGADIRIGDVILEFDGQSVKKMRDLPRLVAGTAVGVEVPVLVFREGKEQKLTVTVGRLKEKGIETAEVSEPGLDLKGLFGLDLGPLSDAFRTQYSIASDVQGVAVLSVADGSSAAERGLKAGDVIGEVAQMAVRSPQDVARELKSLIDGERSRARLLIFTGSGDVRYISLPLNP